MANWSQTTGKPRGAEAAQVEVTWPDGDKETLWMSKEDIRNNAKDYGWQGGLQAALNAYRLNQNYPANALG